MDRVSGRLESVRIASPCSASWDDMPGDAVRYCGVCQLNVYNLSGMTRPEAETLINGSEGRLCVQLFRRADGTVITADCPTARRTLRRRLARFTAALVALVFSPSCVHRSLGSIDIQRRTPLRSEKPAITAPAFRTEASERAN